MFSRPEPRRPAQRCRRPLAQIKRQGAVLSPLPPVLISQLNRTSAHNAIERVPFMHRVCITHDVRSIPQHAGHAFIDVKVMGATGAAMRHQETSPSKPRTARTCPEDPKE